MIEEDIPSKGKMDFGLEIFVPPSSPIPPQEHEKEKMDDGSGEVVIKDRCMA